ncbi:MAG TPA: GTP cyclohydrolase I FolE [Candidatus Polarisedimenticolia bacterium]|nr:GTP cyclohydrolase I FolE [Candidatus Polarisedimenticolia bacterium]
MRVFLEGIALSTQDPALATQAAIRRSASRVAQAWRSDLLSGYGKDPASILTPLRARSDEGLVAVRGLEFASICRHHLLPFEGKVHVAYAPAGRITGLSRLGRLVDCLSRRLQLQETLTRQIVDSVQRHLSPLGAICVVEAAHACMTARGGRKASSRIVTISCTGVFRASAARRREALAALGLAGSRVRGAGGSG